MGQGYEFKWGAGKIVVVRLTGERVMVVGKRWSKYRCRTARPVEGRPNTCFEYASEYFEPYELTEIVEETSE